MGAEHRIVLEALIAGLIASLACGLGVLPLLFRGLGVQARIGLGYSFSGGLMFAASVYNLLLPAFTLGAPGALKFWPVVLTLAGFASGCLFLWGAERLLSPQRLQSRWVQHLGGRVGALVFIAMTIHSIPEGVAVGVGFASQERLESFKDLGTYIAIAISIHNMPEGLAVALPMRAQGASISKCFLFAFLTSLPQPIAAVPASLLAWFFEPLMVPLLGFAAGAMMYLVIVELIPDALETRSRSQTAWSFMIGFGLMVLVQVGL